MSRLADQLAVNQHAAPSNQVNGTSTTAQVPTVENENHQAVVIVDADGNSRCVLRAILKTLACRILEVDSGEAAFDLIQTEAVDLFIIDLAVPDIGGLEICRRIRSDQRSKLIPILMVTSVRAVEDEIAAITCGADAFLAKPLHPEVVRTRARAMLSHKAALDSLEESETILFALAQAVERRDHCTRDHCHRLKALTQSLGSIIGLAASQMVALHRGSYLHDIGKVAVPDAVLHKPGPLSEMEWSLMRQHPVLGEEICRPMRILRDVLPIIRNHHERWDGGGYPDGLAGEQIPLLARVFQVADIYDALTSERPYKRALSHEEAIGVLELEVQRGHRDPELVSLFKEVSSRSLQPGADSSLPDQGSFGSSLESLDRHVRA